MTTGKNIAPRVAALLDVMQLSDVTDVIDASTFERPIYAGNAIITVKAPEDQVLVASVRCASYPAAAEGGNAEIETLSLDAEIPSHTRFVNLEQAKSDRPDLQTAPKVISGGRGVGSDGRSRRRRSVEVTRGSLVCERAAVNHRRWPRLPRVGRRK